MSTERIMYRGTVEYLGVTVTSQDGISLTTQPVYISIDERVTWLTAAWAGTAGTTREAQVLLGAVNPLPTARISNIYVKVTDNPEAPIMRPGILTVL